MADKRFYEAGATGGRRSAPATLRNREPIEDVLRDWLPSYGSVLEIASGTGEHVTYFAGRFPALDWLPSDVHPDALASIAAWREQTPLPNLRAPLVIDASGDWPTHQTHLASATDDRADASISGDVRAPSRSVQNNGLSAVLCINMAHISAWSASLGLLNGSAKVLQTGGALILYGPWLKADIPTAPSNLAFDQQLRDRDPEWGLRNVEDLEAEAEKRGFVLEQVRTMPANNLMLLFRFAG